MNLCKNARKVGDTMKYVFMATKARKYKVFNTWAEAEKHTRLYRIETKDFYTTITWNIDIPEGYTKDKDRYSRVVSRK